MSVLDDLVALGEAELKNKPSLDATTQHFLLDGDDIGAVHVILSDFAKEGHLVPEALLKRISDEYSGDYLVDVALENFAPR